VPPPLHHHTNIRRLPTKPPLKPPSNKHITPKHHHLEHQSSNNQLPPCSLRTSTRANLQRGPSDLHNQTNNIVEHEELGEPLRSNGTEVSSIEGGDQTAKGHVDAGSKEDGPEQQEEELQDERLDIGFVVMGPVAAVVAKGFHCEMWSVSLYLRREDDHTDASDDERDEVGGTEAEEMEDVCQGCHPEESEEYQRCWGAWVVLVEVVYDIVGVAVAVCERHTHDIWLELSLEYGRIKVGGIWSRS
jgi:hypothetical protein